MKIQITKRDVPSYIDKKMECVPLKVYYYEDTHYAVHQALVYFITRKPLEDWVGANLR